MKKLIAGGIAALAVVAAIPLVATAAFGDRGGHGKMGGMMGGHYGERGMRGHQSESHGGEGHGGRGARMHLQEMLDTYDGDGDGSVTQTEIDEWRAARLREFDADGNGELSLDEYQALWLDAMREQMVDQFQSHDNDGDGQVTVEEFGERTSRLVMMRDRNEDGALNLDDTRHGKHSMPGEAMPEDAGAAAQPGDAQEGGSGQDGATEQQ